MTQFNTKKNIFNHTDVYIKNVKSFKYMSFT